MSSDNGQADDRPGPRDAISRRIKLAVGDTNVAALAKALGVRRAAIYDWMSDAGSLPAIERLDALASLTGVSVAWIINGKGSPHEGLAGYAIPEMEPDIWRVPPLAFGREWLRALLIDFYGLAQNGEPERAERLAGDFQPYLIRMSDDGMRPTLEAGDILLVDSSGVRAWYVSAARMSLPRDGIYCLQGNRVRRVQWKFDGSVIISCDNPTYSSGRSRVERDRIPFMIGPVLWRGTRV